MPITKATEPLCFCALPTHHNRYGPGTTWQCEKCNSLWTLQAKQVEGYNFPALHWIKESTIKPKLPISEIAKWGVAIILLAALWRYYF